MEGLLALGSFRSDERVALDVIAREARLPCRVVATAGEAAVWLDAHSPVALLVDIATPGAEKVFVKVRSKRLLAFMPIIAIRDEPNDLAFAEALVWGADDVVTLKSAAPLLARLAELSPEVAEQEPNGQALVAHPDRGRCDVLGRVLGTAGYQVHYAVDQRAARYYASKPETVLVVASTDLCDPVALLQASRAVRPDAAFAFLSPAAKLAAHSLALSGEPGVVVVPATTAPGDVLYASNARVRGRPGAEEHDTRGAPRLPYKSSVAFRGAGAAEDDVGFTYNVSALGLYVRTLAPPPGDLVWLELVPPRADRLIRLMGSVVWSRRFGAAPTATVPPGFGVRIVDGLGDDLTAWVEGCDKYEAEDAERKSAPTASAPDAWRARYPTAASELDKLAELSPPEPADAGGRDVAAEVELAQESPAAAPPSGAAIRPDSILAVSVAEPAVAEPAVAEPAVKDGSLEEPDPFAATAVLAEPEHFDTPPVPLVVPAGSPGELSADEPLTVGRAADEGTSGDPELEPADGEVRTAAKSTKQRSTPVRTALAVGLVAVLSAGVFVLSSQRAESERAGARSAAPATPASAQPDLTNSGHETAASVGTAPAASSAGPSSEPVDSPSEPEPVASGKSSEVLFETAHGNRVQEGNTVEDAEPAEAGVGDAFEAAPPDEAELQALRLDEGVLVVTSSQQADVYVHGVLVGSTNQRLRARCGPRFVRIGAPGRWLSPGQSVKIECRGLTAVKIEPSMK